MPQYQSPPTAQRFSTTYPYARPNQAEGLYMDMPLPQGAVSFTQMLNNTGSATTSATVGDQVAIAHGLGFTPNFVTLTATSNGSVYLGSATPYDATNIYVLGSAASLTFLWKAE